MNFLFRNLRYFVESFMNRTDISEKLKGSLVCDTLLLVGDKSSFIHTTETMYQAADTTKTSILRLDDVGDVLVEAPGKVAQSILLFCQGMGLLTTLGSSERLVNWKIFIALEIMIVPSVVVHFNCPC